MNETLKKSDYAEYAGLERKIKQYSEECGCTMGGYFLLSFLTGYFLFFLVQRDLFLQISLFKHLLTVVILGISFSLAGKGLGILIAKIKLKRLLRVLNQKPGN